MGRAERRWVGEYGKSLRHVLDHLCVFDFTPLFPISSNQRTGQGVDTVSVTLLDSLFSWNICTVEFVARISSRVEFLAV